MCLKQKWLRKQIKFNEHKDNKNNPHGVNSEQVGAYSKQEIDNKLYNLEIDGGTFI